MPPTTYDELRSVLEGQAATQQADMTQYATEASAAPQGWSQDQAIMATALSILPILAGMAIRGKKGGMAGAMGAMQGINAINQNAAETNKLNREGAKLKYDIASDDYKATKSALMQSGLAEARVEAVAGKGGYNKSGEGEMPSKNVSDPILIYNEVRGLSEAVKQQVLEAYPELATEQNFDPETGAPNWGSLGNAIKDRLANMVKGTESQYGEAVQPIKGFLAQMIYIDSGKAINYEEAERQAALIWGEGILPTSMPQVFKSIDNIVKRREAVANAAAATWGDLTGKKINSVGGMPIAPSGVRGATPSESPVQGVRPGSPPPVSGPPGAIGTALGPDGKRHYVGQNREDLGLVQ